MASATTSSYGISTMAQENIFSGLKVVDVATFIAGPAATTILSDFGASVVKVEAPGIGDPQRLLWKTPPLPASDHNYPWQVTNRNKRSIALNLKDPAAQDVMKRLVAWADVLVTNFPPKVRKALQLDYETLAPLNGRLIYADISGYGDHGPEADKPGFDITAYWARSGLMDVTHDQDSPPTIPIPGIGDHATASTLYAAIVTGLYRREKTGKGSKVGTSLIATGAWSAAQFIEGALNGGHFYPQHNRRKPPNALVNPYRASDNRWLMLVVQGKDFAGLARAIGRPELVEDPRFASHDALEANAAALVEVLDPLFASQPIAHWRKVLDDARVIFSVVQDMHDIVADPQMHANKIFMPVRDPSVGAEFTVSSPLELAGVEKVEPRRAPRLGEHSEAILRELGFSAAEVGQLAASHTVALDQGKA
jgi:crotonobetainyl-CoA:carnitine CoA-transferase CaiB-like acyl-CoA transferase